MDDVLRVQVTNAHCDCRNVLLGLLLAKRLLCAEMVSDLATMKVFHHKVKTLFVLETLNLLHDEGIIRLFKNFFFLDYSFESSILQYVLFQDNLKGVQNFRVVFLDG